MVDDDGDDDESDDCDFGEWARTFRAAAEADDYAIFRDHLRRLGLPDEPLLLLEGTIQFVVFWNSYFSLGRAESFAPILRMQTYDPAQATEARYAYTFDLCGKAYARVLVDAKYSNLDLADMNEARWSEYPVVGYLEPADSGRARSTRSGDRGRSVLRLQPARTSSSVRRRGLGRRILR